MEKFSKIYIFTSVLFLVVLAVSPLKNTYNEWRKTQKEYNQIIKKLPQKIKPVPIKVQQIWARDLNRIDRCITCHLGTENSKLIETPQPFTTHPKIYHDIGKFGCTVCHGGQGLATKYQDAHLASEFWDKPVLPTKHIESSCGQCHIGSKPKTANNLIRGEDLINDLKCVACHDLPGFQKEFSPDLDGFGQKVVNRNWLVSWLKEPYEIQPATKMPKFSLTNEEIDNLADFIMSFNSFKDNNVLEPLPEIYLEKKDNDDFIELGKTRFREARCISCHLVDGKGGKFATDLYKIASKATDVWIYNYIKNPKRFQSNVEMPKFGFSNEELAAITSYIVAEFVDWDLPEPEEIEYTPKPNFYQLGLATFNHYNCGGCHKLSDPKVVVNNGPALSSFGGKKLYQIDFGMSQIPHTLYDYIDAKLNIPDLFGDNMRMPRYQLTDEDQTAITTFLLSLRSNEVPAEFLLPETKRPLFNPQGKLGDIIQKYSCLKCHKIKNTGGTMAPDLSIVGSQLKRDWTKKYFNIPYSLRPIMEERMPNLFISDDEVEILLDYFFSVLIDDSISVETDWDLSLQAQDRGRGLFMEKYGCQSCHMVNFKGGYLGPPLDNINSRLQPEWILQWILYPQKYKPETIEPRSGMTLDEAQDVTAYLLSL